MVYSMQVPELFIYFLIIIIFYIMKNIVFYIEILRRLWSAFKWTGPWTVHEYRLHGPVHDEFPSQNLCCLPNPLFLDIFKSVYQIVWYIDLAIQAQSVAWIFLALKSIRIEKQNSGSLFQLHYLRLLKKSLKQRLSLVLVPPWRWVIFSNQISQPYRLFNGF